MLEVVLTFFFCFFVSLFCLYILAREDYLLIRKNITIEQVFDIAFITIIVGLFLSRVFFVLIHFKPIYLNPLVFFYITKYPGFSFFGGLIGAILYLSLYLRSKKFPTMRLLDLFSLSLLASMPYSFVRNFFTNQTIIAFVISLIFPFCYLLIFVFLVRLFLKNKLTSGSIFYISLVSFSILTILDFLFLIKNNSIQFTIEEACFALLAVVGLVLFIKHEAFIRRFKK